jgi:hypothetical protein
MKNRTLLLLLFIGLAWCQNNDIIFLNNGMVYEGEIVKTDDSHLFFVTPNNKIPQGIPLKLIQKAQFNDGRILISNGQVGSDIVDNDSKDNSDLSAIVAKKREIIEFKEPINGNINTLIREYSNVQKKSPYDTFGIGIGGLNILQSATFYKNRIYFGADFLHFAITSDMERSKNYTNPEYEDEFSDDEGDLSVSLFLPRVGYRLPFKNLGAIQSYNQLEGYIIIPMVKTGGDFELDTDYEDELKDALTLMGFKIGHSVEYNFNEQLSLVADYGLNWIFWDSSTSTENEYDGYSSGYVEKSENILNANLSMSYTKLSLHFHF